jgi:hypothetical protein
LFFVGKTNSDVKINLLSLTSSGAELKKMENSDDYSFVRMPVAAGFSTSRSLYVRSRCTTGVAASAVDAPLCFFITNGSKQRHDLYPVLTVLSPSAFAAYFVVCAL